MEQRCAKSCQVKSHSEKGRKALPLAFSHELEEHFLKACEVLGTEDMELTEALELPLGHA